MCTAISFKTRDHYFGRNLDLEYSYQESVTIMPRNYPLSYRLCEEMLTHFAIIGISTNDNGYPLYYDAINEHGLGMAGLNFPGNAHYFPTSDDKYNIAPFELIPWVLVQCRTVAEAITLLNNTCICDIAYSDAFPITPLHWIVCDTERCVTVEQSKKGLVIYENKVGVLTNNPPFPYHLSNLEKISQLSPYEPEMPLTNPNDDLYSRGMGAVGLPGDLSSSSRFLRAVFVKEHSICEDDETSSVTQFFHILGSVEQQQGCVRLKNGLEKTVYTSCCNTTQGIYYYTTYKNSQITAVHMHNVDLSAKSLTEFPLRRETEFFCEN